MPFNHSSSETGLGYLSKQRDYDRAHSNQSVEFFSESSWLCEKDGELEKLVHTNGTRVKMFMYYHNNLTGIIARKYAHCKDWIIPIYLQRSKYFESIVYRNIFQPELERLSKDVDILITSTYRHGIAFHDHDRPLVHPLTYERLVSFIRQLVTEQRDLVPIEPEPRHPIIQSLQWLHGKPAVKTYNTLLTRMGFSNEEIQSSETILAFWRSSFVVRPAVMQRLTHAMMKAMAWVENDSYLRYLFAQDAKYRGGDANVAMPVFRTHFYQLHPFIFERLPAFFLSMMNASVPVQHLDTHRHPVSTSYAARHLHEPCRGLHASLDEVLEQYSRRPIMFLGYDNRSRDAVMQAAYCVDWVVPIYLPTTKYLSSQLIFEVQQALKLPHVKKLYDQADIIAVAAISKVMRMQFDWVPNEVAMVNMIKDRSIDLIALYTNPKESLQQSLQSLGENGQGLTVWRQVLRHAGFSDRQMEQSNRIRCFWKTSFVAKKATWQRIALFYQNVRAMVERDKALDDLLKSKAKHTYMDPQAVVMEIFGTPYYQFYPFIFERLLPFHLAVTNQVAPHLLLAPPPVKLARPSS